MINKKLEDITKEDILSLINNCVCENKNLDYKKELHIESDNEKKEFLADISSFANSTGGDIIFGIEEDNDEKIPTKIHGIPYENDDTLIRRLEDFIRQSIQPIILNIEYKIIPLEDNLCILIIRIPQSIIAPHRIEYKGSGKFFTRNNKGKYPMDVNELRIAFNSGLDLNKRIEEYKTERYYTLIANKYNIFKNNMPIFVVHYIPISAFNNSLNILSVKEIKKCMEKLNSKVLGFGYTKNITIDGVSMSHNQFNQNAWGHYKNNGIIEKASTSLFVPSYTFTDIQPNITVDFIYSYQILSRLIQDFKEVIEYYKNIGINTPIIISCSLLNASNFTIPTKDFHEILGKIDRDILCINDLYVEDFNVEAEKTLKPIFDSLWNACGYEKCPAYDENDNFIGLK